MKFLRIFLLMVLTPFAFANNLSTPVGKWVQVSDKTGKPHSIIQVYEKQGALYGKILKAFPENGQPPDKYCVACHGKLHNLKIKGLEIMKHFIQTDEYEWADGTILDPKNGKIYSCKLTLKDHGNRLNVRGYIGISLFGRTQTWIRQT